MLGPVPCFSDGTPTNDLGIHPGLGPNAEGVPFVQVSGGFTIGNNGEGELPQVGNSFQWSDNISKVLGNHSLKFGGDVRRQRFDQTLFFDVNGEFFVDGTSTNSPIGDTVFSDYLLGFPGSYGQGSAQLENVRSTGLYLFAQDSWKIKPNLTLNYGLRWELNTPIADVSKHVQTFRPGQVSFQPMMARPPYPVNHGKHDQGNQQRDHDVQAAPGQSNEHGHGGNVQHPVANLPAKNNEVHNQN